MNTAHLRNMSDAEFVRIVGAELDNNADPVLVEAVDRLDNHVRNCPQIEPEDPYGSDT